MIRTGGKHKLPEEERVPKARKLRERASPGRPLEADISPFFDLREVSESLNSLFDRVLTASENVAVMLFGPHGCGHLMALDRVLLDLEKKFPLGQIYLNGYLHSDESVALKRICQQLEDRVSAADATTKDTEASANASFAERLMQLRELTLVLKEKNLPTVIILDDFELFANVPKQTLLYNIFELLRSDDAMISVVGVTACQDVDNQLEKRIRSRFVSQRVPVGNPANARDVESIISALFPSHILSHEELKKYNVKKEVIQSAVDFGQSRMWLRNIAMTVLGNQTHPNEKVLAQELVKATKVYATDFKMEDVKGLSASELSLVVCMLRLEEKRELAGPDLAPGFEAYNFETVYEEFKSMKREVAMGIHDLPPQVALKIFRQLLESGIVQESGGSGGSSASSSAQQVLALSRFRPVRLTLEVLELTQYINRNKIGPSWMGGALPPSWI